MAVWPAYAKFILDGAEESFDPSVLTTEMERGVPKQRILNSQVMVTIQGTVLFTSASDIAAFESWYFDTIKRIGWFDFRHPRTGATVQARFQKGDIGPLTPAASAFIVATRTLSVEYLR